MLFSLAYFSLWNSRESSVSLKRHFPIPACQNRQISCPGHNYNPESRSPFPLKSRIPALKYAKSRIPKTYWGPSFREHQISVGQWEYAIRDRTLVDLYFSVIESEQHTCTNIFRSRVFCAWKKKIGKREEAPTPGIFGNITTRFPMRNSHCTWRRLVWPAEI